MNRNIILLSLICISCIANARQKKSTIKKKYTAEIRGHIKGFKAPYIYIFNAGKRDAIPVKAEKFMYSLTVEEPTRLYLSDSKTIGQSFYVEHVPVVIEGKMASPKFLEINGGKTQQELNVLNASIRSTLRVMDQLNESYEVAYQKNNNTEMLRIEKELEIEEKKANALIKDFILSHPNSYVSLDRIKEMGHRADYAELNGLYQSLTTSIKKTNAGKNLETALLIIKRGENGQQMINFSQNDLAGSSVSFSSFKGKYVLVDFWASWCAPCRAENPNILKAYNRFKDKGFTVVGLSLDKDSLSWKKAVKDDHLPWTQLSDLKGWNNGVSTYYGIKGIPANYLVDPGGKIIAKNLRGEALEQKLEELIK